jgi:uncharacterized protein
VGVASEPDARLVTEYVLKVTSRCDLACDHCYVYEDPQQAWRRQPKWMDLSVARLAATRIAEHAVRHGLARVAVILHGGEPLLLGAQRLLPILAELRSTIGDVADLSLQTNGILLTPELCEGFVDHEVRVGVSLDGDRAANDRHRRYAHGGSSHSKVLRALELLRREEFRSAYGGILCTVDVDNDPLRVYEALLDEAPPRIDFLLPHATWDTSPPGRGYAEWLLRIYDQWVAGGGPVSVRLFESVLLLERGDASGNESLGVDNPIVAVIETDGTYELPDSLKTISGDAPHTGLDLWEHSVEDLTRHIDARRSGLYETPTACTACPVVSTCGGGLYAHRFGRGRDYDNPSVYCADLARLIVGIRYRRSRALAAPVAAQSEPGAWGAVTARRSIQQLLVDGAPLAAPEVVDGLVRHESELDRELWLTVATLVGRAHGRSAWQLLVDVEAAAPRTIVEVLGSPAARNRMRTVLRAAHPDVATELHGLLASAAIAAAVAAGFPATLDVPVVDGVIRLPGLGVLAMPGASVARLSSSTRPGELVIRGDGGGEPLVVTRSIATANWRPVPTAVIDGVRLGFDDLDAERLSARDRDAWAAAVGEAWSSVRAAAPEFAGAMHKMITTVIPTAAGPATNPADPWETAVLLVEHVARSILVATHRACGLFDTHKPADGSSHSPEAVFADAYALRSSLQLAEGIERCGGPVDDLWVAARQKQVYQRIDELARDGRLTDLGKRVLNGMDDRVAGLGSAS